MDLTIVVGGREYLRPRRLSRRQLAELASWIEPRVALPELRWAKNEEDPYLDEWLGGDATERARRIDLVLDFVAETCRPSSRAWILAPYESALAAGISDLRTLELVRAARAHRGFGEVACLRFTLGRRAQATLARMAALAGKTAPEPIDRTPFETISLDDFDIGAEREALLTANYNRALLAHAEALVPEHTVFGVRSRGDRVAEMLERDGLFVRPDAPTDAVVAQLSPGGEIFSLLARPVP